MTKKSSEHQKAAIAQQPIAVATSLAYNNLACIFKYSPDNTGTSNRRKFDVTMRLGRNMEAV